MIDAQPNLEHHSQMLDHVVADFYDRWQRALRYLTGEPFSPMSATNNSTLNVTYGPLPLVIGITGHRDLCSEDVLELGKVVRGIFADFRSSARTRRCYCSRRWPRALISWQRGWR